MSLAAISAGLKPVQIAFNVLRISASGTAAQNRYIGRYTPPKKRYPPWYLKQERTKYEEDLTAENKEFLEEFVQNKYGPKKIEGGIETYSHSPLIKEPILRGEWFPNCRRSGLIGIKLGYMYQWLKNGKQCLTTLIQILDNHVIKYIPPEEFVVTKKRRPKRFRKEGQLGCLVVGSVNCDPQKFTKEYNGLFSEAGVMPKKILTRFPIHPCAAIQPGTQLYAAHFNIGDVLDISGVTVDRGFQGVMKRWGFHGQPATHGATKTHRRPGCVGGPRAKVWRGTKMPGCVGNKLRTAKGVKILRIDHKYNVLFVTGRGIPGAVNSFLFLHDTILPRRRLQESPRFPTYYPEDFVNNPLPKEEFDSSLFDFNSSSITFEVDTKKK